ncbi:MAG: nodulation protein NfeD [Bacteroidia bacterium]|nr:nodulation protein NfeD [Bacteroidia bacterium]
MIPTLHRPFTLITLLLSLLVSVPALPAPETKKVTVFQIDVRDEINPGMARQVSKGLEEARRLQAGRILIRMNTYGGLLDAADSIRTALLNSPVPVMVFIDNNAASAGALIAIACEKIYMRRGASIGAATVVNESAEALPDKYQSYMRSMMRSTAEARGRDPRIAEAMVDPRISIPGVNDSGKVLTLTSSEALKLNYCNGLAETVPEALKAEGLTDYRLVKFEPGLLDRFIGWLLHPAISGVLILLMLGGLYYELQHPGIGLPLIVALGAAVLYFAPLYLEGLAANWEILVALGGLLLIAVEIFVLPGFGIAGIGGIVLLLFGLTTSLLRNDGFDFSGVSGYAFASSIAVVLVGMAGALGLFLLASRVLSDSPLFRKLVLSTEMNAAAGYSAAIQLPAPGSRGRSTSLLRPSGKVRVGEQVYTASSESGFIESDAEVEVVAVQGSNLIVKAV